ncbi:hypothetical protein [Gilvimarinus sp. DA14]|uniref:ApeI family dehydratase n=1 Tax=Gilvimarinus sp. DA14 TaxID=2956798 RepID=UPI0020B70969|nr:hypothetical protein [Gilvimarinus sp. DA14]UTF59726.1 hypothetical protein NHM04_14825 [Gilvimarinus sp. DA14]
MIALPPSIEYLDVSHERLLCEFDLQADHPCFSGHFDDLPVLAGVVQIAWVYQLARRHFNGSLIFSGLKSNKFQQLVRPPVRLRLQLDYQAEKGLIKFTYQSARGVTAKGAIAVQRHSVD